MMSGERLARAKHTHPECVELARLVSLAVRVPGAMLRRARLSFLRTAGPEIEAALWFCPLVEVREVGSITLEPGIARLLRAELVADKGESFAQAKALLAVLEEGDLAPMAAIENELVRGAVDASQRPAAEAKLREIVRAIVEQRRSGLCRWALNLKRRIPEIAEWHIVDVLYAVAHEHVFDVPPPASQLGTPLDASERGLLKSYTQYVDAGISHSAGTLRAREPARDGDLLIRIPATLPRVIDAGTQGSTHATRLSWRTPATTRAARVELPMQLRTIDGTTIRIGDREGAVRKLESQAQHFLVVIEMDHRELGIGWLAKEDIVLADASIFRDAPGSGRFVRFPLLGQGPIEIERPEVREDGPPIVAVRLRSAPRLARAPAIATSKAGTLLAVPRITAGAPRWEQFETDSSPTGRTMRPLAKLAGDLGEFSGGPAIQAGSGAVVGMCFKDRGSLTLLSWADILDHIPLLRPRAAGTAKPVIFISYSHKDEPEKPGTGEVAWLSFVQRFLRPAVREGLFELWVDRGLEGGSDWTSEIETKLRACDIFILLVSAHSMASDYMVDTEIAIIQERQARGEDVYFYPLLLTPTPKAGLSKILDRNIRPRDGRPLSDFSLPERIQRMADVADEIAAITTGIAARKKAAEPTIGASRPAHVHISGLPETPYERLVGRDSDLYRLDEAWKDDKTNILTLIAEGGAGKSALVNEWLKRMQADNYRGADAVLGWSFYSQGTKERAASADSFLNWALERLGITLRTTSALAKGDAIAEALMNRRVLLALDGLEPLQHGPDGQMGQLKDQGLRALLRRFAAAPPREAHGLIVLTSRLTVADIARWKDSAAPIVDVERLSDEAGAALLRDHGVWGTDMELKQASQDFGGHPLSLGLLAGFLKETQNGDIRRRDHIRGLLTDANNPGYGHAARMMESYERELLDGRPELSSIMHIAGLFMHAGDQSSLKALRSRPIIEGLTDRIVGLDEISWQTSVDRLRQMSLLAPRDPSAPDAIDAHPLVREWFGARLRETNEAAWKSAHGRLYEHLRDTTKEGAAPTLEQLAPLYQAIAHGCRAGRYREALEDVYLERICRRESQGSPQFYSLRRLGAFGNDLAALSWFFDKPFEAPVRALRDNERSWVLNTTAACLRALGRLTEALQPVRAAFRLDQDAASWPSAAMAGQNLSATALLVGDIAEAIESAQKAVEMADRAGDAFQSISSRTCLAAALHAAGRGSEARRLFADAEDRQRKSQPSYPFLYSIGGYRYCDLLLDSSDPTSVLDRAKAALGEGRDLRVLLDTALWQLILGRSHHIEALRRVPERGGQEHAEEAQAHLLQAIDELRAAGQLDMLAQGLLARAAFLRSIGDWGGAARDLDEIEEIAEPGPMRLHLCDAALERARLSVAQRDAAAPLNEFVKATPPKSLPPSDFARSDLTAESRRQTNIAAKLLASCGYHRRDEEIASLKADLDGGENI